LFLKFTAPPVSTASEQAIGAGFSPDRQRPKLSAKNHVNRANRHLFFVPFLFL